MSISPRKATTVTKADAPRRFVFLLLDKFTMINFAGAIEPLRLANHVMGYPVYTWALAGEGGVCQDHAHIFIAAMRHLGHPARYVSGYLMMNDRTHQDATHAWAEAYFDHIGWIGFDAVHDTCPTDAYVRVASALDQSGAAWVRAADRGAVAASVTVTAAADRLG